MISGTLTICASLWSSALVASFPIVSSGPVRELLLPKDSRRSRPRCSCRRRTSVVVHDLAARGRH